VIRKLLRIALALLLAISSGTSGALGAEKDGVKVALDVNAWLKVPTTNTWTSTQKSQAKKVVGMRADAVSAALASLKKQGASTISVQSIFLNMRRDLHTAHPQYSKIAKQFRLVGLTTSGQRVGVSEAFPRSPDNLGEYLIRVSSTKCTLTTSKTLPKCAVSQPSAEAYLQGVLVSYTYKAGRGSFSDIQAQLELVSGKKPSYTVKKGVLYCDCFESEQLEPSLPLIGKRLGVEYRVTIGADRFSFLLTEKINVEALRKHIVMKRDDVGEWLLTPWASFWS
jgi:hypothetical protein